MEDMEQSPLVSSSSESPPRPQPPFKYQFVQDSEDEEDEEPEDEEDEEPEEEDEDLEELEVLERKPAAGLSAAPVPAAPAPAPSAPLLDFSSDFVTPAPREPLPAAPPSALERQPPWDPSPVASAVPPPSPPSVAAASPSPSKLLEDDEPPARPPPPPPAGVSSLAEPAWTPAAAGPAAPPSTPAAPKRRSSSGSVGECPALPPLYAASGRALLCASRGFVCGPGGEGAPRVAAAASRVGRQRKPGLVLYCLSGYRRARAPSRSRVLASQPHSVAPQKLGTLGVCVEVLGWWIHWAGLVLE